MYRKFKQQYMLMSMLIMLTFSGSLLVMKNQSDSVYYATVRTTETPVRHVTKSLTELGKMDEINKYALFLNQIPNCGAEVLIFLLQKLQGFNNYRHVRLKGASPKLNKIEQEQFVDDFYEILRQKAVPLSFDRHLYFVNFTLFDKQSPTYINIIREPADKAISRSIYRKKRDNNEDLIQCIVQGRGNCTQMQRPELLTIPYFCGNHLRCLEDSDWALQTAKANVERFYPVVGVLEEMNATLQVLESEIPYFFKGVQSVYKRKMLAKFYKKPSHLDAEASKQLRQILGHEYDFYNWVKGRLFSRLQMQSNH